MRRYLSCTQWKLPVPWEPWGEIRPLCSESYRYLESYEQRFALYAVKATGTLRAIRRDRPLRSESYRYLESHKERSPSTQWKLRVPWEPWGGIRPLRSERTGWRSRDRWSLCHRSLPLRAAPSSVPVQKYVTNSSKKSWGSVTFWCGSGSPDP